jgi:hypothetical protein
MVPSLHFLLSSHPQKITDDSEIERDSDGVKDDYASGQSASIESTRGTESAIKGDWQGIALDLDGVTLVDVEVVRYFNACADGRIDSLIACFIYGNE